MSRTEELLWTKHQLNIRWVPGHLGASRRVFSTIALTQIPLKGINGHPSTFYTHPQQREPPSTNFISSSYDFQKTMHIKLDN